MKKFSYLSGFLAVLLSASICGGGYKAYPVSFTLSSSAFPDNGFIPTKYTCLGENVSPPLSWMGAPEGTRSFVLIMEDPDAQRVVGKVWTHWVVYDISVRRDRLEEDVPKQFTIQIVTGTNVEVFRQAHGSDRMNERGRVGYQGPCPPEGRVHTYRFTLYALNVDRLPLDTSRSPTRQEVERAMAGKVLAQTTLHARFGR